MNGDRAEHGRKKAKVGRVEVWVEFTRPANEDDGLFFISET